MNSGRDETNPITTNFFKLERASERQKERELPEILVTKFDTLTITKDTISSRRNLEVSQKFLIFVKRTKHKN